MTIDIRERFAKARERVESLQRSGVSADEIVEKHTSDVDAIVVESFDQAMSKLGSSQAGVSLIALGGYGRRELAPCSDLDLLLLYRGWGQQEVASLNRELMYPLYGSGRELGDRVREPGDVLRSLDRVDETSAVIDARFLAGDSGLFNDLTGSLSRRLDRGRANYFRDLVRAGEDRHRRFGHAGHLLEPNLRDSAGGLRDAHTLLWASKMLPGADGLSGLVVAGYLSALDEWFLSEARSFFLRLRIELHLLVGRHQDQLYLAEQDELARRLGYVHDEGRAPGESLMQQFYAHARQADAIVSSFWNRVMHSQRRRRWRTTGSESVGDGCVIQDGRIEAVAVTPAREDPAGWLRVFRQSVRRDVPVSRSSMNRLQEEMTGAGALSWTADAREVFVDILQSGLSGLRALEEMDLTGFLAALVPEWEPIRCLPQRDLYHRFTVDRHLFAVVTELAASRSLQEADVRDAWSYVDDPQALFVAGLLHDIGKGSGGDHSLVGAALAETAAARIGLEPEQLNDVAFLVGSHLTLVSQATHRDLNDPRTIDETVSRIGDMRRLGMLYLLTRADSIATGPEAWSSFRASLVRELYGRAAQRIQGGAEQPAAASERLAELARELGTDLEGAEQLVGPMPESWFVGLDPAAATRQLALVRDTLGPSEVRTSVHRADEADELVVVAWDRPGLFANITGVLALRGIDVHDAEIYTRSDHIAVDVFRVMGSHGAIGDDRWDRVREDVAAVLDGRVDLDEALSKKAAQSRRRRAPVRGPGEGRVVVDNTASQTHTVVEVHTEDRLGLLRLVAKTLAELGCDISIAKVATYGTDVVDAFYVRDLDGAKITAPGDVTRIEDRLRQVLRVEP